MMRSNRGAARVSLIWLIGSLVVTLVAIAAFFIAQTDLTTQRELVEEAQAAQQTAEQQTDAEAEFGRSLTRAVGWFDRESADPRTDMETMATARDSFRDAFGITDQTAETIEDLLPLAIGAYDSKSKELASVQLRVQNLEGEIQTARRTLSDVTNKKDSELADLRRQLSEEAEKYTSNEQDAATRLANAQAQVNDVDTRLRQRERDYDQAIRTAEKEMDQLEGRISSLSRALAFQKEPDRPDGTVLTVSDSLPLGWIDLGTENRLPRGMVFRVRSSSLSNPRDKAWAEVTDVDVDKAEVRFFDVADPFDPVVPGDLLINPVYDPDGGRNAVLAGRFTTPNEKELRLYLDRIGINVQDELEPDTHYLIVGSPIFQDEDGELLEEPRQVQELGVYREAADRNVNIVPLSDIRSYFRL